MTTETVRPAISIKQHSPELLNLLDICVVELKKAGQRDNARDLLIKVFTSRTTHQALEFMREYCDITLY